jgi:LysR family glycine cleavage system transcriptional activator
VSTLPSLAANWLIPRLGSLRRLHPQLDVRVQVAPGLTDFAREDVDVAIRYGHGRYPGLRIDFLMDETFFPVLRGEPRRRSRPTFRPARGPVPPHPAARGHRAGLPRHVVLGAMAGRRRRGRGRRFARPPLLPHLLALQAAASGQGWRSRPAC